VAKFARVLITGGAGFVGSHLCERFLDMGSDVICVDNYFTGSKANIQHLIDHPKFEVVRHDICEPFLAEVDLVLNFACPASPVHYQHNPIKTVKTNVLGTMHMLGLCKRVDARFVQASTSEVYGDPQQHPQTEAYWGNVNPIGIRSCYDEGKRIAETLAFDYHRAHGVDIRIARIFNTYGPRMALDDGRVVSNFICQALTNKPITVYGEGQQTRSFCYVDDLVEGIIRLALNDKITGPVNLGNGGEFTILELAEKVINLTGSKSKIIYEPLPKDDPQVRKPNTSLAKSALDWSAEITLEEGLKKAIPYFKEQL
jgi:UDP-glucuronate decarboxylase